MSTLTRSTQYHNPRLKTRGPGMPTRGPMGGSSRNTPSVSHYKPGQACCPVRQLTAIPRFSGSRKEAEEDLNVLQKRKQTRSVKHDEHSRLHDFRRKQHAAMRIQKAWRNHKMRSFAILLTAKQAVHKMRLRQGAEEFHKQIAALTIQLAWRKYIRKKLMQSLHPNKRQLRMWDPELIAMKQRALVSQVYGEQIDAPFWHPNMLRQQRPYWAKLAPSSAALSYNFAIDQYHPLVSKQGVMPSPFLDDKGHPKEFIWQMVDEEELQGQLNLIKLQESRAQSRNYSYNMRR